MTKQILVPLDGTPESAVALIPARALARPTDQEIVLLRVVQDASAKTEATAYLARVAKELAKAPLWVRPLVREGDPAKVIAEEAAAATVGMIAMATHGRTGLARMRLGSVAQGVLAHAPVPLLLVKPGGKRSTQIHTLLVPVDGTAGGALAISVAVDLARAIDAQIILLQVAIPTPDVAYDTFELGGPYVDPETWDQAALSAVQEHAEAVAARLRHGGLRAEAQACLGDPAEAIAEVAEGIDAQLVVMSTHAYTGAARALLGSVADAVVRSCHRPVLLVRRDAAHQSEVDRQPAAAGRPII
jgi:nucleotide-binding universal stress UspA family protein